MLFIKGIAVGFAIAAPIGPVGIICIRKALADGRIAGFVAGLGAALADGVFGGVMALGLGAASHLLDGQQSLLKAAGGLFMLGLGLHTWRAAAVAVEPGRKGPGLWRDFASTFAITITNPATMLGIVGVFAAMGAALDTGGNSWPLVAGIFVGSTLWWLILSAAVGAVRGRFTPERMRLLNHASGALLMAFGAAALGSLALS